MTENFTWFVAGWCAATLVLTAYLVWMRRDGAEQSTERKLRETQRALAQAKQDYAQCNAERIRAMADCENEVQYRNRDRRALAAALDRLTALEGTSDCVCDVGVQECPVHPGRLWDQERKVAFRKDWDARVVKEDG